MRCAFFLLNLFLNTFNYDHRKDFLNVYAEHIEKRLYAVSSQHRHYPNITVALLPSKRYDVCRYIVATIA